MLRKPLPSPKGQNALEKARPDPSGPLGFLYTPTRLAPADPGGAPTLAVNDPFDALAFLSAKAGSKMDPVLSTVDPDTAILPGGTGERSLAPQTPHHGLMRLRFQFPHLPIIPFPNSTKSIALVGGAAPVDVTIPDTAQLAMFRGDGAYYVSINGAASIPANTLNDDSAQACTSAYKPEGFLFYLGNVNQISLIAPSDGVVTILFFNGE